MLTSDLIESLVAGAGPVARLRPPIVRAAGWLLLGAAMMLVVALGHGVRPDLASKLNEAGFTINVAAALSTGVLAAVAAFIASVPGRARAWLWLPVPALLVWAGGIGYGCLTNWVEIGPEGVSLGETARCFGTLVTVGTPLSLLMLVMLRHVARLAPIPVALTGSLAVSAMTAVSLSIFHPLDATAMILLWNIGVTLLFAGGAGLFGKQLLGWIGPR